MKKRPVKYPEEHAMTCPACGSSVYVETDLPDAEIELGYYRDDDAVMCVADDCGLCGKIYVDEDHAFVNADW